MHVHPSIHGAAMVAGADTEDRHRERGRLHHPLQPPAVHHLCHRAGRGQQGSL